MTGHSLDQLNQNLCESPKGPPCVNLLQNQEIQCMAVVKSQWPRKYHRPASLGNFLSVRILA